MPEANILTFPERVFVDEVDAEPVSGSEVRAEVVALSSVRENLDEIRARHTELVREYTFVGLDQAKRDEIRQHLGRLDRILYPEAYS